MPDAGASLFRLLDAGLNLVAVFNLGDLPSGFPTDSLGAPAELAPYKQLILFGHAGPGLWQALQASPFVNDPDPVDNYSADLVRRWFADTLPGRRYEILYPGRGQPPLQRLGELAGWHHTSPFHIGVNHQWGSWFAYRAVALADSDFAPTAPLAGESPCSDCRDSPCLAACPVATPQDARVHLGPCIDHRLQEDSLCRMHCPARLACPAGAGERYSPEQIRYHYGRSLETIKALRKTA